MKNHLLPMLAVLILFLQSCDERITPQTSLTGTEPPPVTVPVPPVSSTSIDVLTAKSWQYNEVLVRGGGKTEVQFSRPNSIGLSSDFAITKVNYKKDGSHETELKGNLSKGTWELSKDEKVLIIKDSNGFGTTFDVLTINKVKLEISFTVRKANTSDADWLAKLKSLKLPETSTEYTIVFSFVPI